MVHVQVGKEFPDMRQNETEIKFMRGRCSENTRPAQGRTTLNRVLSPLLYPGYKEWDRGLAGHLLIGGGMYTGSGKRRADTFSLWGGRGDGLYSFIIVIALGREGR